MARCLLHVGLEMELASIVGWFPVWLVSRVVSFPCECVVLTLSLIASGVESIVLKLGSLSEQKIPAAYDIVTFPENESNAPPILLV